ncbi:unnamed protein product [Leptosia nina]|uniref:Uncharacterized protein n=1 Tax=Leptosia nina TaxID=320188 RepID=A0AAV1JIC5_9NEOP
MSKTCQNCGGEELEVADIRSHCHSDDIFASNVNTKRGTCRRASNYTFPESELNGILLAELREFKVEVLKRLDVQTKVIKDLKELCETTKTQVLELHSKYMRVVRGKKLQENKSTAPTHTESSNLCNRSIEASRITDHNIQVLPTYVEKASGSISKNINKVSAARKVCVAAKPTTSSARVEVTRSSHQGAKEFPLKSASVKNQKYRTPKCGQ